MAALSPSCGTAIRRYLFALSLCSPFLADGQDAELLIQKGVQQAEADKLDAAIGSWTAAIRLNPYLLNAWTNRGVAHMRMGQYEQAVADMDSALTRDPQLPNAWLSRGTALRYMNDPRGAIADYNKALSIDPEYAKGYYNRGLAYEMLGRKDSACADYRQASELGLKGTNEKLTTCADSSATFKPLYVIYRLKEKASDPGYGFVEGKPIRVGNGPDGGPANERAFLNLLRDGQGDRVRFSRTGSCCAYPTENGFMGMGMLDRYEVIYRNEKGKKQKAYLFISMYDYEEPLIPVGFGTTR